jgi:hypothetical protein
MDTFRTDAEREATVLKESYLELERLLGFYQKLDPAERSMADQVIAEWVLSGDENLRFDALALVDEFRIRAAMPALGALSTRLASSAAPSAPYERQNVDRILLELAQVD